jgi:peptide/nickel transport system permease protein
MQLLTIILSKLSYGLAVVFGVILVIFLLFHILPGDPVSVLTGGKGGEEVRKRITTEFGLDKPLPVQFMYYLNDLSPIGIHANTPEVAREYRYWALFSVGGNMVLAVKRPYLRRSYQRERLVSEILYEDIEGTLVLAIVSMFFATVIGIFIGVIAALKQNTWIDYTLTTISILGISTPSFVMAIIISVVFGHYLKDYTGLKLTGSLFELDPISGNLNLRLANLVLPTLTLAIRPLAIIVQLTRSSMLEVLNLDYIRTAKAKGLNYVTVIRKHALRNALNPVVTAVSGWLASLMAGAFFVEYVFDWKGLGTTTIGAINERDLPIIMGATILIAIIFVVMNIVVDILYALIDPRIRLK